jgi:hypothetical protein
VGAKAEPSRGQVGTSNGDTGRYSGRDAVAPLPETETGIPKKKDSTWCCPYLRYSGRDVRQLGQHAVLPLPFA